MQLRGSEVIIDGSNNQHSLPATMSYHPDNLENGTGNGGTDSETDNPSSKLASLPICLFPCAGAGAVVCTVWGFIAVWLFVSGIVLGVRLSPWFFLMLGPFALTLLACVSSLILLIFALALVVIIRGSKHSVGDDEDRTLTS